MYLGKRDDILDAVYAKHEDMTIANGYSFDWSIHQSIGNGTLGSVDDVLPSFSARWMPEISSPDAGQSLYHLSASIIIRGEIEYNPVINLNEQDREVQRSKSLMIEDIRKAFGYVSSAQCVAGLKDIVYNGEQEINTISGHILAVELEFVLRWYDTRS